MQHSSMPSFSIDHACPDEEDIAAYVCGRLAASRVHTLESHVSRCSVCRRMLSALAQGAAGAAHATFDSFSPTLAPVSTACDTELPVGARIGRYVVLEWRGAGGMGVVYAAHDPELRRNVALKLLRNDGISQADRLPIHDLLLREAQAMAQLAHPNVVTVFDVGSVDEHVFIAMELVEGCTLKQWLAAEHRAHSEIIAVFLAAGSGLAAAHAAGLIHRDFKPDNVMIGDDGRVCVTDFGLARRAVCGPSEATSRGTAGSAHGTINQTGLAGTLAYMAPEQYLGRRADARADQFSFAVALYEALHGERPFAQPWLVGADLANRDPAPPAGRSSRVPVAVRQVLLRALSPIPDERYPSMDELLAALAPRARSRRGLLIGVGAVLMALTAAASVGAQRIYLRQAAERRAELVSRWRDLAPEFRTRLQSAHMLPLHDIRPALEEVRSMMREVERQLETPTGQDERALGYFVLGEGWRALGDHERALASLEAAWVAGERGPRIDAALGNALGAVYEARLDHLEQTTKSPHREAEIRAIEQRYRDPAMVHLRAALAARYGSPAYLEALIAFREHRFADASERAHAVFAESPTFYEAGMLEASAHNETGRQLLAAARADEAKLEFATARRIFERVLEIGRSDDDAWLRYGHMVYTQANALNVGGTMPPALREEATAAFHNVQRINPENGKAYLREAQIHLGQGNIEIIWLRDPSPYVDKALALTEAARVHGADAADVERDVCVAHWERGTYQATRGLDPRAAFEQATAACNRAIAARPDADGYGTLGVVYGSIISYEEQHGLDPTHTFELGERNVRASLAIEDDAGGHYALAVLWMRMARYQLNHGGSSQRGLDNAIAELEVTVRMAAARVEVWTTMSTALALRAQSEAQEHEDPQRTLAHARDALRRALAIDRDFVPALRHRLVLAELEGQALLTRNADPAPAVDRMRTEAGLLVSKLPDDGFVRRLWCRAELLAARWALANHHTVDPMLARAASEAARARDASPHDAMAWTTSAEVELLRAEAARARGSTSSAAAAARGLSFIERAMAIDPRLSQTLTLRDELERWAHRDRSPAPARGSLARSR